MEEFDEFFRFFNHRKTHMTIPKEQMENYELFDEQYWKDTWFDDENYDYNVFVVRDSRADGKIVMTCSVYTWNMMPYASLQNWIGDEKLGMRAISVGLEMYHHTFDWCKKQGIKKVYMMNNLEMMKDGKFLRRWFNTFGDTWTHCIEEVIEPGRPTKWRGFQVLTGFKTWPVKMVIRSMTLKDYGLH